MDCLHDIVNCRWRILAGYIQRVSRDRISDIAIEWGLKVTVKAEKVRLRRGARYLNKI